MSDLIERLRKPMNRDEFFKVADGLCREAADTIDRLTRELAEARDKALEEAAKACDYEAKRLLLLANDDRCITDIRWNSVAEAQQTMRAYASRHQSSAAHIRALKEKP